MVWAERTNAKKSIVKEKNEIMINKELKRIAKKHRIKSKMFHF